jgi:erythronate-4-phosphate dehydrogenase
MLVIADENMPHAEAFFSRFGEVRLVHGRRMSPDVLRDADLLMIRSITRVNAALLDGSRVRFVGTATIGTDHVDRDYLASRGIAFSAAPGCNAESVAQYMAAALAFAAGRTGRPLSTCSIGIVGVGNCGSRVHRVARALGMTVLLNDPPLARATGDPEYRPLEELMGCDYLALHVPLTKDGPDPTWNLIDNGVLDSLRPEAVVINACRGHVVDEAALRSRLDKGWLAGAILDAWEGEPAINLETADRVMLGTPHIAGYSHDGKVNGTRMIYEAACRVLAMAPEEIDVPMPAAAVALIEVAAAGRAFDSVLAELILRAYPIYSDDADLRAAAIGQGAGIAAAFDALRKNYPLRREPHATAVCLLDTPRTLPEEKRADNPLAWPVDWAERIRAVGFRLEAPAAGSPS